jgi:hypothetical protein
MSDPPPRSRRRRLSPSQQQIDSRALEIAAAAEARIDGHEDVCSVRFENLDEKVDDLKSNFDKAHKDNQDWMRRLEEKVDKLATRHAKNDGQSDGVRLLGMAIKDWLIVLITAGALVVSLTHH